VSAPVASGSGGCRRRPCSRLTRGRTGACTGDRGRRAHHSYSIAPADASPAVPLALGGETGGSAAVLPVAVRLGEERRLLVALAVAEVAVPPARGATGG
jgi:hypothetical protein